MLEYNDDILKSKFSPAPQVRVLFDSKQRR